MSGEKPGLRCTCAACGRTFHLTADADDRPDHSTYIAIRACESGGVYSVQVVCPWRDCGHVHEFV